ncbi:MAG: hypothetical protein MHMPM18_005089, partial [Marteilia pararefringens]
KIDPNVNEYRIDFQSNQIIAFMFQNNSSKNAFTETKNQNKETFNPKSHMLCLEVTNGTQTLAKRFESSKQKKLKLRAEFPLRFPVKFVEVGSYVPVCMVGDNRVRYFFSLLHHHKLKSIEWDRNRISSLISSCFFAGKHNYLFNLHCNSFISGYRMNEKEGKMREEMNWSFLHSSDLKTYANHINTCDRSIAIKSMKFNCCLMNNY